MKRKGWLCALLILLSFAQGAQAAEKPMKMEDARAQVDALNNKKPVKQANKTGTMKPKQDIRTVKQMDAHWKVRLTWPVVAGAVSYRVTILKGAEDIPENIALTVDDFYINGGEISLQNSKDRKNLYWKVRPLDYEENPIGKYTAPQPLPEDGFDTKAPLPLTEYNKMKIFPLYPVFSWVPMLGMTHYQVEVYRHTAAGNKLIRTLAAGEYNVYEDGGYTYAGSYAWRVRAVSASNQPLSDWSPLENFTVTGKGEIAALGDSITHGGGACSVPPSYQLYNWETYAALPIFNLGYSGNTTQDMLDRFERDVVPAQPKVLVIMGGVNDYRTGKIGWDTVVNLATIRDKCNMHGIIPVFATVTPLNPDWIAKRKLLSMPPTDWKVHQQYINEWVMRQQFAVDVSTALTDERGFLRSDYTTDGLHPDAQAKKIIGEAIGAYLRAHFSYLTNGKGTL